MWRKNVLFSLETRTNFYSSKIWKLIFILNLIKHLVALKNALPWAYASPPLCSLFSIYHLNAAWLSQPSACMHVAAWRVRTWWPSSRSHSWTASCRADGWAPACGVPRTRRWRYVGATVPGSWSRCTVSGSRAAPGTVGRRPPTGSRTAGPPRRPTSGRPTSGHTLRPTRTARPPGTTTNRRDRRRSTPVGLVGSSACRRRTATETWAHLYVCALPGRASPRGNVSLFRKFPTIKLRKCKRKNLQRQRVYFYAMGRLTWFGCIFISYWNRLRSWNLNKVSTLLERVKTKQWFTVHCRMFQKECPGLENNKIYLVSTYTTDTEKTATQSIQ